MEKYRYNSNKDDFKVWNGIGRTLVELSIKNVESFTYYDMEQFFKLRIPNCSLHVQSKLLEKEL